MKVGLFVPCYVDALYPEAGIATFKLLKHFGIDVSYPEKQTCCGQPMGNAGFEGMSKPLARKFDELFRDFDYIVEDILPSFAERRARMPVFKEDNGHRRVPA